MHKYLIPFTIYSTLMCFHLSSMQSAETDTQQAKKISSPLVSKKIIQASTNNNASVSNAFALNTNPAENADTFMWLEDLDSEESHAWVAEQNHKTQTRFNLDPRYQEMYEKAYLLFTAQDRIALPAFMGDDVYTIWYDELNPHGIWQRMRLDSYLSSSKDWETLLSLDDLSKNEKRDWCWKGAIPTKDSNTYLVKLSDGGGDSIEIREFDIVKKEFVENGFFFSNQKQFVAALDKDTLIVGRNWEPTQEKTQLTACGYPYIFKVLSRGQSFGNAQEIFRGESTDAYIKPVILNDRDTSVILIRRKLTYFNKIYYLMVDNELVQLPLPEKTKIKACLNGSLIFIVQEKWQEFLEGDVLSINIEEIKANPKLAQPILIMRPTACQAISKIKATRNYLVIQGIENVQGFIDICTFDSRHWHHSRLDVPKNTTISIITSSNTKDEFFVTFEGFLNPTSLWLINANNKAMTKIKELPSDFNSLDFIVEQYWACSSDKVKIPYFIVRAKKIPFNGLTPTLMYGYGGFGISMTPSYKPEIGKLWLEQGGAYVLANIRGGGEFGPSWHQAATKENRQQAFDDFLAIANDLFERKITSPQYLGIYGGSNGGILTSVCMTQKPELFKAVVIASPLIDMLRYSKLSAGAAWIGEYGNPDIAEERAYIARYSAYQNLRPDMNYPEPYITTNSKDDRVHPGHARKFAAKLQSLGYPVTYFEDVSGGHATNNSPKLAASKFAGIYLYLTQKLMD